VAEDDNVFETVRRTAARLEAIEMLLEGNVRWQQMGIISLLREVQAKQKTLEWKTNLLLVSTVFLLLLSLGLSMFLVMHMGAMR